MNELPAFETLESRRQTPPIVDRMVEAVLAGDDPAEAAAAYMRKPPPAPHADEHTGPYRRAGKARKRDLAVYRRLNEPALKGQREITQERRRAQRAARP